MKDVVLNYSINGIVKKYPGFDEEKIEVIKYGLESLYILLTKTIFILGVAIVLGIFREVLIFSLLYNLIKIPSFGLHATKSLYCYISSTLIFIIIPYFSFLFNINIFFRAILGSIGIIFVFKNAPADTYKKPIVSQKRREKYKIFSTLIAIFMVFCSLLVTNPFLQNSFVLALIVQCFMISPTIYKMFKLPYNNYKNYVI